MQGQRSPSAARRQLGARLRQLRDDAKLTGAKVGAHIGSTHTTISKIENGNNVPEPAQLDALLDMYGVAEQEQRGLFHQLLDEASGDGWWEAYDDVLPHKFGTYIGLELDAKAVDAYEDTVVHGLLQTRDYASALLNEVRIGQFPDEVDRLVEVRMHRAELFNRTPPLLLSLVMEEVVIRRPVGGAEIMRAQLEHLLEMQEQEYISIQVLPLKLGAHAGLNGPLSVLNFEDEPTVGYTEGTAGNNYLTKPRDIGRCKLVLQRLHEAALPPQETSALIREAAEELK